ncbi:MAG: PKD domain-containing protein, partial [Candidatus Woesearchaeota archaeon]
MNNRILMPLMLTIILFFLAAAMPSTAFSVSLSATPQEGHAPLTVSYECNAHGGFFPVSYAISFGDGTTSTNNKGTKTYTQPGDYDIKCVAIDGLHFQAEDTKSIIVTQKPPVTTFESITLTANPQKGDSPLTVSYSCSAIGGYEPVSYVMSFGDGSTSTNRQGTKTYTKDGVYTMKCTAIDALHFTISTEKTITVTKPKEPTPFTGMDLNVYPKSGYAPLTVSYSCNAHGGNAPVSYAVSFGDGTTSTNKEGTKTYTQPGNYKITCTAIDALHFQISRSQDVVVKEDKPLMVSLTANPKEGFAPLEVSYTCSASGNSPFSYSIDFGDGTKSTNNVGSKTYNSPGNYKLSCTVTDDKGKTKTVSQSINVKDKPPIIGISFDINPKSGMAPLKTDYECRVLGGVEPISYDIVFGDGTSTSISKGSKTYTQHGSYVATCTAKDAVGQSVSSSVNVDVTKMPPGKPFERIDLLVDPTVGHAPLTVQYSCNAVGGYEPVSYAISFGDGTTSTNKQGSKTYAQPGTYDIKCTAIDALHNQISTKASVTVNPKVSELKSVFTVDPKEGFAPLKVDYHCSASGGLAP